MSRLGYNLLKPTVCTVNNSVKFKSNISSSQYCMEYVKQNDYENFICTLLLKTHNRTCAFAIRSFNVEVAKVSQQVSEKSTGLMRFKFWEETLEKCYSNNLKNIPQHPVAIELYKVLSRKKLSRRYFSSLIAARQQQFDINTFKSLDDIEKYAEMSVSSVYYLILEGCDIKNIHADHAASHLGKAQGLTQMIRGIPHSKKLNMIGLPQDLLAKYRVSQEDVLRCKESNKLNDCIYEAASRAHQHLMKSRSILKNVPENARQVFLPAVAVDNYLNKLQKVHYNIFHPVLQHRGWTWLVKLWINHFNNKY